MKDNHLWRTLWSIQVPNKIKNLVWRACRNSLPTKENLVRHTIIDNPICDRFKQIPESSLHALWSCGELDVVWEDDSQWQCRRTRTFVDFEELLSWLITNQQDLELFSTSTWLIWTQSNQVCLNKPSISSHLLAATAKELVAEFAQTIPLPPYPRLAANSTQTRWRPPTQGMVKINCDGATFRDQKKYGIDVVIREDNGMVLASMSKQLPQLYSALEVEAMAASTALSFASQLGFHWAILESDSLTLATALRNNSTFLSPNGLLMEDIKFHASFFIQLLYSHVKREGNKVAHKLARHALCISDFSIFWCG